MSRKDAVAIAAVIAAERARYGAPCTDVETIDRIARGIAKHAATASAAFDATRFLRACGVPA